MKVYIEIPENIMDLLYERGYTQKERTYFFKTYLMNIMNSIHDDFQTSMEEWLDELTEDEIDDIKHGKDL